MKKRRIFRMGILEMTFQRESTNRRHVVRRYWKIHSGVGELVVGHLRTGHAGEVGDDASPVAQNVACVACSALAHVVGAGRRAGRRAAVILAGKRAPVAVKIVACVTTNAVLSAGFNGGNTRVWRAIGADIGVTLLAVGMEACVTTGAVVPAGCGNTSSWRATGAAIIDSKGLPNGSDAGGWRYAVCSGQSSAYQSCATQIYRLGSALRMWHWAHPGAGPA